jgi:hypothetical protein
MAAQPRYHDNTSLHSMNNWLQAGDLYKRGDVHGGGGGGEERRTRMEKDKLQREEKICFLLLQMFEVLLNSNFQ